MDTLDNRNIKLRFKIGLMVNSIKYAVYLNCIIPINRVIRLGICNK